MVPLPGEAADQKVTRYSSSTLRPGCGATARILSRANEPDWVVIRETLQACLAACKSCGAECRHHTEMQHCQVCADACDACAAACQALLDAKKAG